MTVNADTVETIQQAITEGEPASESRGTFAEQLARLPFPRPPFDENAHLQRVFDQRAKIRGLTIEVTNADDRAKRASEAKKDAHQALADAHAELDELIDILERERNGDVEDDLPEPAADAAPGKKACQWEIDHPGEACPICTATGA